MNRKPEGLSFPIGESLMGTGYPVFFDPHYCITLNKPPVSLITGSPGSGKTFSALLMATHASIADKLNFIIDPKGDFINLKTMSDLGLCGPVSIWSLVDPEDASVSLQNQGILDPMLLKKNINECVALTIDVIKQLVGELSNTQKTGLFPLVKDVAANRKTASFARVVDALKQNSNNDLRALGSELDVALSVEISKLLIRPKNTKPKRLQLTKGTMVASLLGLELPPENKTTKNYTTKEKVSVTIMWLLASLVIEMMKGVNGINKVKRKTLIIDEAWVVLSNPAGAQMINSVSLLGRSMNMATILITQSPTHLRSKDGSTSLNNTISTRFAFRNNSSSDNKITVKDMRLPEGDGWDSLIGQLGTGQCLMKDCQDQQGIIHIVAPEEYEKAFNTNPNI